MTARGARRAGAGRHATWRAGALGLAAALCACGVKGPPRPPARPAEATPARPAPTAGAGAETTCDTCGESRPEAGGAEGR